MSDLTKWLRTYWSDDYSGPPMASDELGRKAADEIERLEADKEKLCVFLERGGIDSSCVLDSEDDGIWQDENERLEAENRRLRSALEEAIKLLRQGSSRFAEIGDTFMQAGMLNKAEDLQVALEDKR